MILLNNENNFNIWALYAYIAFFNISRSEVSVFLTNIKTYVPEQLSSVNWTSSNKEGFMYFSEERNVLL